MRALFIVNNISGGVYSVIKNIIEYSGFDYPILTIITSNKLLNKERVKNEDLSENEILFEYSKNENFYSIANRFKRLIDSSDIIITNDWLELGMISILGLQNKVIQILHGDYEYYYNLAHNHDHVIDTYICVSEFIFSNLLRKIPHRNKDIFYLPHPIPHVESKEIYNKTHPLKCLFIGRLTEDKGFHLIPKIDALLKQKDILVEWGIAADTSTFKSFGWLDTTNVKLLGLLSNHDLLFKIKEYDIFILPSKAEGFPVSLVETMKAGLVPLVSDLPSGIPELVVNGHTGFTIQIEDYYRYSEIIELLNNERSLLEEIGVNAKKIAIRLFNPETNGLAYFRLMKKVKNRIQIKKTKKKTFGSRLDNPLLPNYFVKIFRDIRYE